MFIAMVFYNIFKKRKASIVFNKQPTYARTLRDKTIDFNTPSIPTYSRFGMVDTDGQGEKEAKGSFSDMFGKKYIRYYIPCIK